MTNQMNKEYYFKNLEAIITDIIFFGNSEQDLNEETINNMWRISLDLELVKTIKVGDYREFFLKVIQNRQEQVFRSPWNHGMIFYLWFDPLACQLRFNLISALHGRLPFQCNLEFVENMDEIIIDFLNSPFHNGLPLQGY
ncbi:hypothetical protein ABEX47_08375 [Paenibacillus ehimensis]|uniref:hypothetical protein n=1 Tax=Paenibacillus ehimensis TaxID=79264 RepID=UPI002DBD6276|nr:hypothetical protein [Paenibacillus ehimensis]MEC0208720.1 hypothetical protein [Paenibacillus ehimensis]